MRSRLWVLIGVVAALPARAKPKLPTKGQQIPDIEEILSAAGWTMTPEMSAKFSRPGDILDGQHATLLDGPGCFAAEVEEGAYATMEVTRSMAAGVRMRTTVVGARAGMTLEKKLVFDTPIYRQIPRLALTPSDKCLATLRNAEARGDDISDWYVITESLSAIIQQQQCGSYDAKVGAFVISGEASVQEACSQTSLDPVAVAYKTIPVSQLLANSGPTTMDTMAARAPAAAVNTPAMATTNTNFGGGGVNMDVDAMLREQRCNKAAQESGDRARKLRLQETARVVLAQASAAWAGINEQGSKCTDLPRAQRQPCIAAVEQWIENARSIPVVLPAGVESLSTDCGSRQSVFEEDRQTFSAAELPKAQALLTRLKAADPPVSSHGKTDQEKLVGQMVGDWAADSWVARRSSSTLNLTIPESLGPFWVVAVGAGGSKSGAEGVANRLQAKGFPGHIAWLGDYGSAKNASLWVIYAGPFAYDQKSQAVQMMRQLQASGHSDAYAVTLGRAGQREQVR